MSTETQNNKLAIDHLLMTNLNVLDRAFAAEQIKVFDADLPRCRRITYERWKKRPVGDQIWDSFLSLFAPLM